MPFSDRDEIDQLLAGIRGLIKDVSKVVDAPQNLDKIAKQLTDVSNQAQKIMARLEAVKPSNKETKGIDPALMDKLKKSLDQTLKAYLNAVSLNKKATMEAKQSINNAHSELEKTVDEFQSSIKKPGK